MEGKYERCAQCKRRYPIGHVIGAYLMYGGKVWLCQPFTGRKCVERWRDSKNRRVEEGKG